MGESFEKTPRKPESRHIGIVGAGISGLRCADKLLSHGFKVTILEARDRIGGRICQSEELGYTTDIGPNWIHAWTDSDVPHPIFKAATETSTPLHHWNNKQLIYKSDGEALPDEVTDRLSTLLWEIIEQAFNYSQEAHDNAAVGGDTKILAEQSLYDFIGAKANELLPDENERALLLQMSEMFGAYVGEPVTKQSLRFAWMEECCGGEEMFVESNYGNILKRIAAPALKDAVILLRKRVTSVITPEARSSGALVSIETADGDAFSFDEVVMTTPLGWLKHNLQVFSPPLPSRLTSAVNSLGLSQLEKVYITFPSVFWTPDPAADTFPCYTNWLTPRYAEDVNPKAWPQEIWDLSSFKPPHNHPTILFYLYGDCSRYIVNMIYGKSPEERFRLLDDFFHPYYSRLPGYSHDVEACKPKAILATEWLKDELAGGAAYCNFQVGIEAADQDVIAFRQGCSDRRLWFCGEHAAPFEECGTVAGAYLSGEHAAENIVRING